MFAPEASAHAPPCVPPAVAAVVVLEVDVVLALDVVLVLDVVLDFFPQPTAVTARARDAITARRRPIGKRPFITGDGTAVYGCAVTASTSAIINSFAASRLDGFP